MEYWKALKINAKICSEKIKQINTFMADYVFHLIQIFWSESRKYMFSEFHFFGLIPCQQCWLNIQSQILCWDLKPLTKQGRKK